MVARLPETRSFVLCEMIPPTSITPDTIIFIIIFIIIIIIIVIKDIVVIVSTPSTKRTYIFLNGITYRRNLLISVIFINSLGYNFMIRSFRVIWINILTFDKLLAPYCQLRCHRNTKLCSLVNIQKILVPSGILDIPPFCIIWTRDQPRQVLARDQGSGLLGTSATKTLC